MICLAAAGLAAAVDLPGIDGLSLGAGTMPRVYAVLLALCGAALALRGAFPGGARARPVALRPAAFVVAALLVFALTVRGARLSIGENSFGVPSLGLAATVFLSYMLASAAAREGSWRQRAAVGAAVSAGSVLLFVHVLHLPIPPWPVWR